MVRSDDPLRELASSTGETLEELSRQRPQLVVFLRHFGCTFCRESLSDLRERRAEIEASGCGITLIHMVDDQQAEEFFTRYELGDVPRISDPDRRLYQMFGLDRGGIRELFGLKVWLRGVTAGLFAGHGIGGARGNPFQMPGVYVFSDGNLVSGYQHSQASDRPDYLGLVKQALSTVRAADVSTQPFDRNLDPVTMV